MRAKTLTLEEWASSAACVPGSYGFETLVKMFGFYDRHGMAGGPRVLAWLLERAPNGLAEFIVRHRATSRGRSQC